MEQTIRNASENLQIAKSMALFHSLLNHRIVIPIEISSIIKSNKTPPVDCEFPTITSENQLNIINCTTGNNSDAGIEQLKTIPNSDILSLSQQCKSERQQLSLLQQEFATLQSKVRIFSPVCPPETPLVRSK